MIYFKGLEHLVYEKEQLMKELIIRAEIENLDTVLEFVSQQLDAKGCSSRIKTQILVAVEEIFVNIAHYAYAPEIGEASICVEMTDEPVSVTMSFMDGGKPFDPLAKPDPDISLPAGKRQIGGLGVFMVKKTMDDVSYEYKDGKNILTIKKNIR